MDHITAMNLLSNYFAGRTVEQGFLERAVEHLIKCEVCLNEYALFDDLVARIVPNLVALINKVPLSCQECIMVLPAYHDRNLEEQAANRVEQHLTDCEQCLVEYDKLLSMRIEEEVSNPDSDALSLRGFVSEEEWNQKGQELGKRLEQYVLDTGKARSSEEILVTEEEGQISQRLRAFYLLKGVFTAWYLAKTRRPTQRTSVQEVKERLALKPIQIDDFTICVTISKSPTKSTVDISLNIKSGSSEHNRYEVFLIPKDGDVKNNKTGSVGNVTFRDIKWEPCKIRFSGAPYSVLNLSFLSGNNVAQFLKTARE